MPPKVDVCEKRYVFNRIPEGTAAFSPTGACPPSAQPDTLVTAYQSYQKSYDAAFAVAAKKGGKLPPKPSIAGLNEANLVSEWTKKRARGERIPIEPPSLNADGSVTQTARMGRIDSPEGKRQAALDEAAAKKAKAEADKQALALAQAEEKKRQAEAAEAAAAQPVVATGTIASEAAPVGSASCREVRAFRQCTQADRQYLRQLIHVAAAIAAGSLFCAQPPVGKRPTRRRSTKKPGPPQKNYEAGGTFIRWASCWWTTGCPRPPHWLVVF